ncbi:uncharacterized protein PHACADRAFT_249225 [Phanerochaete carnosa HHB-10118-sp]|uniref:Uncharacterized protein n=1 Tax=Phanerochaete carnosa (strain HHB-10118-sp) TaxID=650164 RepID=K5WI57_PHACS|nr:uncharacterized protein PHACADRAFT_249225 [Phanerochaete carnosa HHB-10118-sp]EKM59050.1 hypothetical protein PHACADRAFT_249225 [Phanerochaete carnosa HHB-10118-sp]
MQQQQPPPPLSPWTHFAIFTGVLAPVALFPYLAVRRHLISLHRKVSEVSQTNAALQRDLKAALLESSIRREEHDRLVTALSEVRREFDRFRAEQSAKELQRARGEERTRSQIDELAAEHKRTRVNLATLRDLSPSLADIAAFMQEVEVQQGYVSRKNDGRGIERIRQFAYRLGSILTSDVEAETPAQDEVAPSSTTSFTPPGRTPKKEKKAKQPSEGETV